MTDKPCNEYINIDDAWALNHLMIELITVIRHKHPREQARILVGEINTRLNCLRISLDQEHIEL